MSKFDANSDMPYEKLVKNLEVVKGRLNRPLTLSEKVSVLITFPATPIRRIYVRYQDVEKQ